MRVCVSVCQGWQMRRSHAAAGLPLSCKYNTARAVLSRNYALLLRPLFRAYYYRIVIFVSDAVRRHCVEAPRCVTYAGCVYIAAIKNGERFT